MPDLGSLLTIKAAAEFLDVCPNTLRNWDRDGKITVHRHPTNGYRLFAKPDLEVVLEEIQRTGEYPTGWVRPNRKPR